MSLRKAYFIRTVDQEANQETGTILQLNSLEPWARKAALGLNRYSEDKTVGSDGQLNVWERGSQQVSHSWAWTCGRWCFFVNPAPQRKGQASDEERRAGPSVFLWSPQETASRSIWWTFVQGPGEDSECWQY